MSIVKRLLLVDSAMHKETVSNVDLCKNDKTIVITVTFSNIDECVGIFKGLSVHYGSFSDIGIVTHDTSFRQNRDILLDSRFVNGLKELFQPLRCSMNESDPVLMNNRATYSIFVTCVIHSYKKSLQSL